MKFTVFNILWQSLVDWCKENFKIKTIDLAQTQQWCSLFASEMTHGRHFKVMERYCNTSTQAWVALSWLHWVDHAVCLTGTRLQKWMFTSELSLERAYEMFQGKDSWMCIEFPYQMLGISFPYQFKVQKGYSKWCWVLGVGTLRAHKSPTYMVGNVYYVKNYLPHCRDGWDDNSWQSVVQCMAWWAEASVMEHQRLKMH